MTQEAGLRLTLAVLAALLYFNHHILHSKPATKKAPLAGIELWLVVAACAWTVSLIVYVLRFALGLERFAYTIEMPLWVRWSGAVVMALCFPLSSWIYSTLGAHFSKKLELRADHRLVDTGPYKYVRHPMYSTLFLCAVGTCLLTADVLVMATVVAVAAVFVLRIKKEESMMLARFGDTYRQYQSRTAALVPGLL